MQRLRSVAHVYISRRLLALHVGEASQEHGLPNSNGIMTPPLWWS